MQARKRIGLIAHDARKPDLLDWVVVHRDRDHGSGRPGGGRHGVGEVLVEGAGALGILRFGFLGLGQGKKREKAFNVFLFSFLVERKVK